MKNYRYLWYSCPRKLDKIWHYNKSFLQHWDVSQKVQIKDFVSNSGSLPPFENWKPPKEESLEVSGSTKSCVMSFQIRVSEGLHSAVPPQGSAVESNQNVLPRSMQNILFQTSNRQRPAWAVIGQKSDVETLNLGFCWIQWSFSSPESVVQLRWNKLDRSDCNMISCTILRLWAVITIQAISHTCAIQ